MKRAVGSCRRRDTQRLCPQIVARFDRETFDEVAAYAERRRLSFNAALNILVTWGLMTLRRDEETPPPAKLATGGA